MILNKCKILPNISLNQLKDCIKQWKNFFKIFLLLSCSACSSSERYYPELTYYKDTETGICLLMYPINRRNDGMILIPCTPEVEKVAIKYPSNVDKK